VTVLKWTMESVIAAIAVAATAAGSIYSTSYHWGTVNQQIVDLQNRTLQTDVHIAKHDDQLTEIQQQNAGLKQSIDDIKDTVHDIQAQVRKPKHGDNE
jgi:peptidoglycan hydrolase CwlO-like protein